MGYSARLLTLLSSSKNNTASHADTYCPQITHKLIAITSVYGERMSAWYKEALIVR